MEYNVDVLFPGFSGKLGPYSLGWGTTALVRNNEHNILFDTGGPTIRNQLIKLLGKYKMAPSDVDTVILSHLHFDHAYNIDMFPHARFIFTENDWNYICAMGNMDPFIDPKTYILLKCYDSYVVRKDNEQLFPGLSIIFTPGHTPGSMSLVINRGNEKWVLSGDAVKNRGELRTGEVQMTLDPAETKNSIAKIRNIASRVLPGHDGWLRINGSTVEAEGGNDIELIFAQGVTVNGGKSLIKVHMD